MRELLNITMPTGVYIRTEEHLRKLRENGRKQGRKLADSGWHQSLEGRELHARIGRRDIGKAALESGQAHLLGCKQGKKNVESGHLARISVLGASAGAVATRNRNGPNKEEQKLYTELKRLGIEFESEVNLGYGMGVADVLIDKIVGELDGGGHWANFGSRKNGLSDEEYRRKVLEKDAQHDRLRAKAGMLVIRDLDAVRLAKKLATEWLNSSGGMK